MGEQRRRAGVRTRVLAHLQDTRRSRKAAIINEIRRAGKEPLIEILAHGLRDAESALRVEAAAIDLLGLPSLANQVRGWRAIQLGRVPLREAVALYRRTPITITEPAILIRINRLYRPAMTAAELYDATRGVWKVGPQRELAKYAFAVFEAVVREVYEIQTWVPAGSTFTSRLPEDVDIPDRWEFVGRIASDRVRRRYVNGYVGQLFPRGARYPVAYVNID